MASAQPSHFEREIHEQPEALTRLLARGREAVDALAARIAAYEPRHVVIAARGSSDNAARYAKYLFGAHNRLSVGLATPSLFTLYEAPPDLREALVIGISQSGQSPDIVAVLAEARRQGALTLALTNDPGSPLAQAVAHCLDLYAGEERSVAATKTYTTQLFALAMLSAALEGRSSRWDEIAALPAALGATLALNERVAALVEPFQQAECFLVIGRGFNYATAFEAALKIKETSYIIAEPYSSADFRHGPVAMVDRHFPVLLIAPAGRVFADVAELRDVLAARGAELVVISDDAGLLAGARAPLPLPGNVPEWLSPIVAVVPAQLWALHLALARGFDPDEPRGLSKITHTR